MVEIVLPDMRRGYRRLMRTVLQVGDEVEVRGFKTYEVPFARITFHDGNAPLLPVGIGRKINTTLAAIEALAVLGEVSRPDLLLRAAPRYADVLVNPSDLNYGAYGPRVSGQLARVISTLRQDPRSRQAIMSIWRPSDLSYGGDRPCTLTIQFMLRPLPPDVEHDQLHMIVTMRSQDVWLGAGLDMFVFGQLRDTVARVLGVKPGIYTHNVGSLHLYERNFEAAKCVASIANAEVVKPYDTLPRGIVQPAPPLADELSPTMVPVYATHLLDHVNGNDADSVALRHANPWYARALGSLTTTVVPS
jgi:thymidylate synthase